MKNFVLIIAFFCTFVNCVFAQAPDPASPFDTLGYPDEHPYVTLKPEIECIIPDLEAKSLVLLDDIAYTYLRFSWYENLGEILVIDKEGEYERKFSGLNNEFLLLDLPLNKTFQIYAKNTCDELVPSGTIETKTGVRELIELSPDLFEFVNNSSKKSDESLYDAVVNANHLNYYERLSFIQRFFNKEDAVNIQFLNTKSFPEPKSLRNDDCRCDFVLVLDKFASPSKAISPGFWGFDYTTIPKTPMVNSAKFWYDKHFLGAAKFVALHTEGFKATGADQEEPLLEPDAGNYSHLTFLYLCVDYEALPRECECEKSLKLFWRYTASLQATAVVHTGIGTGWGDKNAHSSVSDLFSVFLYKDEVTGFDPVSASLLHLETNGREVAAACERDINEKFWANAADLTLKVGALATTIALANGNAAITGLLTTTTVNSISNSTQALINTPYLSQSNCSSTPLAGYSSSVNAQHSTTIRPNQMAKLFMFSLSNTRAGGKRSWYSSASVNSRLSLLGLMKGGINEDDPHCCTKPVASWLYSAIDPSEMDLLRKEIAANLFSQGYVFPGYFNYYIGSYWAPEEHYGHAIAKTGITCDTDILDPNEGNQGGFNGNNTWLASKVLAENQGIKVSLIDMSGRVIYSEWHTGADSQSIEEIIASQIKSHDIPTGLLIVRISSSAGIESKKIFVSNH